MSRSPVTPEILAALPPETRAVFEALIDYYEGRLAALQAENDALRAELVQAKDELAKYKKTPRNSSLPPSSEHPHAKPPAKKSKSKRKQGGQPGHKKHDRPLLPSDECAEVHDHRPNECRNCGSELKGSDAQPLRHQVWELPKIEPLVTEHRRHRLTCKCCGTITCGDLPPGVPTGQAGPRLIAFAAVLMANFRQSKRKTALFLSEILNTPCSTGWVVKLQNQATAALRPVYEELAARLPEQDQLNIDESPHKQGKQKTWLWTFVAITFTLFALRPSRKADALHDTIGVDFLGVIGCDRAKMYLQYDHLQWCWAHLKRDFQAWIDSDDKQVKRLGHDLMREVNAMFAQWHRVRDGTLTHRGFQRKMKPIRQAVEGYLLRGLFSGNSAISGSCRQLYDGRANLWTFVDSPGIGPTNNDAERALRHAVIWRKLSFGTQSETGNRFVETMLTVIETCRQQQRNTFAYVTQTLEAQFANQPRPNLNGA
jgi:transposase